MTPSKANTLTSVAATTFMALVSLASLGGWAEPGGDVGLPDGRDVHGSLTEDQSRMSFVTTQGVL